MSGMRIGLAAMLAAALLACWPASRAAAEDAHAALVIDADTGEVLHAVGASRPWYPASLTKLMTLYLTFAEIRAGRLALDDTLTVSIAAAAQPPTELGLDEGDTLSVEDAIEAVIVRSANDAAVVLAERIAGSEREFADLMTVQARRRGMLSTVYRNASGLPDPGQVTTAHDQAVLALALMRDFPEHYHYFGLTRFSYGGRTLSSYNGLLVSYDGADGLKTGFTCDSGYNVVVSARRDGRRLLAVYLGAPSSGSRNARVSALLDDGFAGTLAAGNPEVTLTSLMRPADSPPPKLLGPDRCATGTATVDASGHLPGWGIVFGAFPQKEEAQTVIKEMRSLLRPEMTGGHPLAIRRTQEGTSLYSALLVGLAQEQATAACKHLWAAERYCLALRPEVLNNPQALWR